MHHDPHESHSRIASFAKNNDDETFFESLNQVLAKANLSSSKPQNFNAKLLPIIYIVGAPRSGTTLLSQFLSRYLPVGYIDNIVARFWLRPQVGIRISRALLGVSARESIAFDSKHGVTQDIAGPHEFGYFWRYWLKLDRQETHKLDEFAVKALNLNGLRQVLEDEILTEFSSPVVFKNVICGFQAEVLTQAHPSSLFIRIHRNIDDVVRSILKCRMERYGSYDAWWSLKPQTYPIIAKLSSSVQQVTSQVIDCTREFDHELSKPCVHSINVDYLDLINNPASILSNVCNALKVFNYQMSPLPMQKDIFRQPRQILLPEHLEVELNRWSNIHGAK